MLHIIKGSSTNLIFTGYELATIMNPYYLFIFTSATEDIIKYVGNNLSITNRFQKVLIPTNLFINAEAGTWRYKIREQASSSNTDESLSGNIVEEGYLYVHENDNFVYSMYSQQSNIFKTYDGE